MPFHVHHRIMQWNTSAGKYALRQQQGNAENDSFYHSRCTVTHPPTQFDLAMIIEKDISTLKTNKGENNINTNTHGNLFFTRSMTFDFTPRMKRMLGRYYSTNILLSLPPYSTLSTLMHYNYLQKDI